MKTPFGDYLELCPPDRLVERISVALPSIGIHVQCNRNMTINFYELQAKFGSDYGPASESDADSDFAPCALLLQMQ